jgi:hypothetical protein
VSCRLFVRHRSTGRAGPGFQVALEVQYCREKVAKGFTQMSMVAGVLAAQPPPALCLKTWLWYSHSRVLLLQMMEGRVSGRNPLAMCLSQRQTDRGRND